MVWYCRKVTWQWIFQIPKPFLPFYHPLVSNHQAPSSFTTCKSWSQNCFKHCTFSLLFKLFDYFKSRILSHSTVSTSKILPCRLWPMSYDRSGGSQFLASLMVAGANWYSAPILKTSEESGSVRTWRHKWPWSWLSPSLLLSSWKI